MKTIHIVYRNRLTYTPFPGSFASIYKFLLNALPILLPTSKRPRASIFSLPPGTGSATPYDQDIESQSSALSMEPLISDNSFRTDQILLSERKGRLSLTAQAHQVWVRKKTRRWQSVLAGSVAGGLAIMCEKKGNRMGVAQQMFVRYVADLE